MTLPMFAGDNSDGVLTGREELIGFLSRLIPPAERHLVWLVGGSVRDIILGRASRDIDLLAALPATSFTALGFRPVTGKTTLPILFRHFAGFGSVEVTLIAAAADLPDDLRRRDFTINALALGLDGVMHDPLRGLRDLQDRNLRVCSASAFTADPLRIFRALRFVAEGFSLGEESLAQLQYRHWNEKLEKIPVERFSRELLKALAAREPQRFFLKMLEHAVGSNWLPELFRMPQVPAGPLNLHPEGDLLTHSLQVLQRVAAVTASPLARFCAFFHDIGKLSTDAQFYPHHHCHGMAGFRLAGDFCRRLALPSEYGRALAWTSRLHGQSNRLSELRPATRIRVAELAIKGGIVAILPLVAAADKAGTDSGTDWQSLVTVARLTVSELGIDPARLLALKPEKRPALLLQRRVEYLRNL